MTVSSTIMTLGPTIDMIWVGKLGAASIAGVGVSGIAVMLVNSLIMGLFTGLRAMVGRFVGAKEEQEANHVSQQAFVVCAGFSMLAAVIGIFLAEQILMLLGVEADVVREGAAYMRVQLVGIITMASGMVAQNIMQASGDAITPMKIAIGTRIFHAVLCPFLIFGWWLFPRMGVTGAAMTSIISQGAGAAIALWVVFSGRTRLRMTLRNFRLDGNIIWRMVKIGIPASVTGMERSFADFLLVRFIAPFGTFAVAAHSLCQRVDGFIHMPAMGMGQASGVLAAQNLGAGQPERAEKTGWLAAGLYTGVMVVGAIVIWFWAEYIVRLFNPEPHLVDIASTFLRIQIVHYMVFGVVVTLLNCLNGVGDTMIPMWTTLITLWGVQIPLAYLLPKYTNLGVYGVRWGIVIAIVMRAITYATYFKLGRWKRKQI
jgi:putative MATE family efflux protein